MAGTITTFVSPENLEKGLKAVYDEIPAVSTTIDSASTNDSVPTSKAAYDAIEASKTIIDATLGDSSTNDHAAGSKAVYDAIEASKVAIDTTITTSATDDHVPSSKAVKAYVDSIPSVDLSDYQKAPATGRLMSSEGFGAEYSESQILLKTKTVDKDGTVSSTADKTIYQLAAAVAAGTSSTYPNGVAGLISGPDQAKLNFLTPVTPMTDAEVTAMINRIKGVST